MSRRAPRHLPLVVACAAALLTIVPNVPARPSRSRHLWATVNICDTIAHPNTIGIRGSMPGAAGRNVQLYMRFRVQYFRTADQHWHNISSGADSGWMWAGRANVKARQAGVSFKLDPPPGTSFELRGKVYFEWRRGKGKVLDSAALLTTAGHHSTAGADPAGYSSDTCVIQ